MDPSLASLAPGDVKLINAIVSHLKSQGLFDQFRKHCLSDVDTKPGYQNLKQRVEGYVSNFLQTQQWRPDLNKNQLRDSLRRHINESGMVVIGVDRIVDQVVNPLVYQVFYPQIESVVCKLLGKQVPPSNTFMQKCFENKPMTTVNPEVPGEESREPRMESEQESLQKIIGFTDDVPGTSTASCVVTNPIPVASSTTNTNIITDDPSQMVSSSPSDELGLSPGCVSPLFPDVKINQEPVPLRASVETQTDIPPGIDCPSKDSSSDQGSGKGYKTPPNDDGREREIKKEKSVSQEIKKEHHHKKSSESHKGKSSKDLGKKSDGKSIKMDKSSKHKVNEGSKVKSEDSSKKDKKMEKSSDVKEKSKSSAVGSKSSKNVDGSKRTTSESSGKQKSSEKSTKSEHGGSMKSGDVSKSPKSSGSSKHRTTSETKSKSSDESSKLKSFKLEKNSSSDGESKSAEHKSKHGDKSKGDKSREHKKSFEKSKSESQDSSSSKDNTKSEESRVKVDKFGGGIKKHDKSKEKSSSEGHSSKSGSGKTPEKFKHCDEFHKSKEKGTGKMDVHSKGDRVSEGSKHHSRKSSKHSSLEKSKQSHEKQKTGGDSGLRSKSSSEKSHDERTKSEGGKSSDKPKELKGRSESQVKDKAKSESDLKVKSFEKGLKHSTSSSSEQGDWKDKRKEKDPATKTLAKSSYKLEKSESKESSLSPQKTEHFFKQEEKAEKVDKTPLTKVDELKGEMKEKTVEKKSSKRKRDEFGDEFSEGKKRKAESSRQRGSSKIGGKIVGDDGGWSDVTVSSVHTSDLSDYDDHISLTDSEVDGGRGRLSSMSSKNSSPVKRPRGRPRKDQSKKPEPSPRQTTSFPVVPNLYGRTNTVDLNKFVSPQTEEGSTLDIDSKEPRRELRRQRKVNPRYSSEEFSSIFSKGKDKLQFQHDEGCDDPREDFVFTKTTQRGRKSTISSVASSDQPDVSDVPYSPRSDISETEGTCSNRRQSKDRDSVGRPVSPKSDISADSLHSLAPPRTPESTCSTESKRRQNYETSDLYKPRPTVRGGRRSRGLERYDDSDLYKPRPVIMSRRARGNSPHQFDSPVPGRRGNRTLSSPSFSPETISPSPLSSGLEKHHIDDAESAGSPDVRSSEIDSRDDQMVERIESNSDAEDRRTPTSMETTNKRSHSTAELEEPAPQPKRRGRKRKVEQVAPTGLAPAPRPVGRPRKYPLPP